MPKTEIYKTETTGEHLMLLTLMHSYAQHHPKTLLELDYHQIPSQKAVYKLREEILSSVYHFNNVTILHISGSNNIVKFVGMRNKDRNEAKGKLERLIGITLNRLENSIKQ